MIPATRERRTLSWRGTEYLDSSYFQRFIALAPNTPATADAIAITTFRIMSHTDFFIAIIYLLSRSLNSLVYSVFLPCLLPQIL